MPKVEPLRFLRLIAGGVLVLIALYCFLGVLQAMSLFTGEQALRNVNLWGSLCLVAIVLAVLAVSGTTRTARERRRSVIAAALWSFLAVLVMWPVAKHLLAVERCLDQGGSFNYVLGICDTAANHEALSLAGTHGFLLASGALAALFAGRAISRLRAGRASGENGL